MATVLALGLPIETTRVPGLFGENVVDPVLIEVVGLVVVAGVVDPTVLDVTPVELAEVPAAVLPSVVEAIGFVCPLRLDVVVAWLLVLPTWPAFSFGLGVPELALASFELIRRCLARDR
jgi:hypothetical protein